MACTAGPSGVMCHLVPWHTISGVSEVIKTLPVVYPLQGVVQAKLPFLMSVQPLLPPAMVGLCEVSQPGARVDATYPAICSASPHASGKNDCRKNGEMSGREDHCPVAVASGVVETTNPDHTICCAFFSSRIRGRGRPFDREPHARDRR